MKQIFGKKLLEWLVGEERKDRRKKEKDRKKGSERTSKRNSGFRISFLSRFKFKSLNKLYL